jgi:hypothetical protein
LPHAEISILLDQVVEATEGGENALVSTQNALCMQQKRRKKKRKEEICYGSLRATLNAVHVSFYDCVGQG